MSALSELEKSGLILPKKSHGSSNEYRLNTSPKNGTATEDKTSTDIGTSTKNGPVPKTDKSGTKNGTLVVPKTGHEPKKKLKESYKYENTTIKLSSADFDRMAKAYPNLDLITELDQLDLELSGEKKWFMTLNAKLNYRNKTVANNAKRQQPDKPRSPADRFRAKRQAERGGNGPSVGKDAGDLRPQMGEQLRDGTDRGLGAVIDGDFTRDDR